MKLSEAIREWKRNITTNTAVEYTLALRADINAFSDVAQALERENVKLQELVRDMWRFIGTACKKYPRLFDPATQGGQMVNLNMIDTFEQRMNELGVEVESHVND